MTKRYQKPTITTFEIPERTAYACNFTENLGCGEYNNLVAHAVCGPSYNIVVGSSSLGQC